VKKKEMKKIVLSKETLRRLDDGQAQEAKGGGGFTPLCSGSCYNSCPPTCDC